MGKPIPMRNAHGQYVSSLCPDPNCGGIMQPDRDYVFRCDGLTFNDDRGPLHACRVTFNPRYDQVPA